MGKVLALTKALVEKQSVTPIDKGCQALIQEALSDLPFTWHSINSGDVTNCLGILGENGPLFVFAGHTDVVPVGDEKAWDTEPFIPTEKDNMLYGRGVSDMKGGLAAMIVAIKAFCTKHKDFKGSIGLMLTSDEEGPAQHGTKKIMEWVKRENVKIEYCLIGEPTGVKNLGDTIKIGRRGSLTAKLKILGKQGHVGYPHLADNAIHRSLAFLNQLSEHTWDTGNQNFQASTLQITDLNGGVNVGNVIPGEITIAFNIRFCPEQTSDKIKEKIEKWLTEKELKHQLDWTLHGEPYFFENETLLSACTHAVEKHLGYKPEFTTHGGASDGRFIAPTGVPVIEFGLVNHNIHAANEGSAIDDLEKLAQVYESILEKVFIK